MSARKHPAAVALGRRGGRVRSDAKRAASAVNLARARAIRAQSRPGRTAIANEYRDSDGYWIELRPGWQNGNDPGTHGIVESTKTAAYEALTGVIPCQCDECQRLIAQESAP